MDSNKSTGYIPDIQPVTLPTQDTIGFYNLLMQILPDIVEMQNTGVPVNLPKCIELGKKLDNIKQECNDFLNNNPIVQEFLHLGDQTIPDFNIHFNSRNQIHITYVINLWLECNNLGGYTCNNWNKEDIQKLQSIINSEFIERVLNDNFTIDDIELCNKAMDRLSQDKKKAWLKNNKKDFNVSSPKQRLELLRFLGFNVSKADKDTIIKLKQSLLD